MDQADALLRAHADMLVPQLSRYSKLKLRLQELEGRRDGVQRISALLDEARRLADAGQPLDAMSRRAHALHLARPAFWLTEAEQERLRRQVEDLRDPIRLARGRAAVQDARRALDAGDRAARDDEVQRARRILPGLKEQVIAPLLAELNEIAGRNVRSSATPLRSELAARHAYEDALEAFGRGEFDAFIEKCLELEAMRSERQVPMPFAESVADLLFSVLEPDVTRLAASVAQTPPLAIDQLLRHRERLARMTPWRSEPRWQALDSMIATVLAQTAEELLASARQLAEAGDLEGAMDQVAPAVRTELGEVGRRAQQRAAEWQRELELRRSIEARQQHWARIEQLAGSEQAIDAARELHGFEQRYANELVQADVDRIKQQISAALDRDLSRLVAEARTIADGRDLQALDAALARLAGVPIPGELRKGLAEVQRLRDRLAAEADEYSRQIELASRMATPEHIILILHLAPKLLQLHPEHDRAQQLLEGARSNASTMAEQLLRKAKLYHRNPRVASRAAAMLERVLQLDPDGELGAEARELLRSRSSRPPG
ncbi:MAG TPA: hypothetical protein VML55_16100 [Planctomycetaceae bacterium]|nr:hypothetical protein [Planctomycetaceae bacterium]